MKMRKTIDKLYQERLSNVETNPPADVWQNISDRLPQKKKNRVIPIWFTLAGTAAAIVLALLIFRIDLSGSSPSEKIATTNFEEIRNSEFDHLSPEYQGYMNTASTILEAAILETKFEILKKDFQVNALHNDTDQAFASTKNNISPKEKEAGNQHLAGEAFKSEPAPLAQSEKPIQKQENPILQNERITEITNTEVQKEDSISRENDGLSFTEETNEDQTEEKFKEENILKESDITRRFRITPTAAAVYLDNFGNENLLDDQFSNKEGGGEVSMSFGVNLAYKVSDKINLRSGVNLVNLAYNTQEINYGAALNSQAFNFDSDVNYHSPDNPSNGVSPVGFLRQSIDFIEVPIEIEYVILKKKSGINLIGGFSTLFHEANMVELNFREFNSVLGEANNINEVSFSVNAGVGFNYKITSRFQFNLEPILKYQINTFDNTSNLNSYYLGIYSGLSFKF